jgi:MFS family permease
MTLRCHTKRLLKYLRLCKLDMPLACSSYVRWATFSGGGPSFSPWFSLRPRCGSHPTSRYADQLLIYCRIVLCITNSLAVFSAVSFLVAVSTVTPQLMLPLVGDLAPPNKRAAALSIVTSGFMLGILIARVLSGALTNYTSWRNVYWMSCGLQYLIFILLWLFMPDYPSKNPGGLNYFKMLWSIFPILFRNPVLVQACLISFFISRLVPDRPFSPT